jgi:hypothetical protein
VIFVTDDEWKKPRDRAILAAFQTGRPVFANFDGVLHYIDGDHEPVADDGGVSKTVLPRSSWWSRMWQWLGRVRR